MRRLNALTTFHDNGTHTKDNNMTDLLLVAFSECLKQYNNEINKSNYRVYTFIIFNFNLSIIYKMLFF